MEQITVRLSSELIEELDSIAEDSGRSRAEVIRSKLDSVEDSDDVIQDYEQRIAFLETHVDRLQNEKLLILEQRDDNTELQRYVNAGLLTRAKWYLTGRSD